MDVFVPCSIVTYYGFVIPNHLRLCIHLYIVTVIARSTMVQLTFMLLAAMLCLLSLCTEVLDTQVMREEKLQK